MKPNYQKAQSSSTVERISAAIDTCKGDVYKLSEDAGISYRTLREYLSVPKNISLQERLDEQRFKYGTHPQSKAIVQKAEIKKVMKQFNGNLWNISRELNISNDRIRKLVHSDPELNAMRDEEQEKHRLEKLDIKLKEEEEKNKEFDTELTSINWDAVSKKFLPHQLAFAELSPMEVKHPALVGGFGSGKTMAIPLRWLKLIDFRMEQGKPCELMILEPSNEMIRDIIVPAMDEFFENLGIKTHYVSSHQNYTIIYRGKKHKAMLRSADRPRALTGKNLTDFIIDEFDKLPYSKQKIVWRECIARIRRAEYSTGAIVTTPEGFKLTYELWGKG